MPLATEASAVPFARADLPELLALQHVSVTDAHRLTAAGLEAELCDAARAGGAQVVVVRRGGAVVGFAGWVTLGPAGGELYGVPLVAADAEAAGLLLDRLRAVARAWGARAIRCSAFAEEHVKAAALEAAGFRPALAMLTLRRPVLAAEAPEVGPPAGLFAVPGAAVIAERLAAFTNLCFRGVANSPPITGAIAAEAWRRRWQAASQVWADGAGAYRAFLSAEPDGTIAEIGVHPDERGRGLGRRLLAGAVRAAAAARLPALRALVASDNAASLRLHTGTGFTELERRTIWEGTP